MARPVDQETTTTEKVVCYPQFPRGRALAPCVGRTTEGGRPVRRREEGGDASLYCSFHGKEQARLGEQAQDRRV